MRSVMALTVIPLLAALSACATFAPDAAVAVKQIGPDRAETLLDRGRLARRAGVRGAGPGALGGEPARRYAAATHRPGGTLGHGDAGLDRPGRDPRRGARPARRVSLFRRRTCPGPPGDRRRQDQGCAADRRPARCRYPGRTGRRADGGRGPADSCASTGPRRIIHPGPGRQARRARDANGRRCFSPPSYGCARPCGRSAARSGGALRVRAGARRGDPVRRGKTPFGDAPGSTRVRCAGRSRAPELGDRRHAGAVVGAAFRHLPVRRSDADRAGLHGVAAGAGRDPPGLPAGTGTGPRRERAACAAHRRARADRERRAALARLPGPLVADARPAGRGAVSPNRSRDHAVAAMAGRGLGARYGARRRYLRRRSRPAEPDLRGRRALAPPASRGHGLGPRSDNRLHRRHGPRAPAADRRDKRAARQAGGLQSRHKGVACHRPGVDFR